MHHSKLAPIVEQLLEIHNTKKLQIYMSFIGHVNKFEVDVFIPSWVSDKTPDLSFSVYIDQPSSLETFEKQITTFIKLFNSLNS